MCFRTCFERGVGMSSKITLDDLKWAAKHFPYTVKEQMELDKYGDDVIDISEVQDE